MLKHDLHIEFPEYQERINNLKLTDTYFATLLEEYNSLDQAIKQVEYNKEYAADLDLEEKKKKRLAIKDKLHRILLRSE